METDFDSDCEPSKYWIEVSIETIPGKNHKVFMAAWNRWVEDVNAFAKAHSGECLSVFNGGKHTDDATGATAYIHFDTEDARDFALMFAQQKWPEPDHYCAIGVD